VPRSRRASRGRPVRPGHRDRVCQPGVSPQKRGATARKGGNEGLPEITPEADSSRVGVGAAGWHPCRSRLSYVGRLSYDGRPRAGMRRHVTVGAKLEHSRPIANGCKRCISGVSDALAEVAKPPTRTDCVSVKINTTSIQGVFDSRCAERKVVARSMLHSGNGAHRGPRATPARQPLPGPG
jgi:hypothetical protein